MRRNIIAFLIIILAFVSANAGFIRFGSLGVNFGQNSNLGLANADMWVPEDGRYERPGPRGDRFRGYDLNDDGAVSSSEIEEFYYSRFRNRDITAYDKDADGVLDREEFTDWFEDDGMIRVNSNETSTQET